MNKINRYLLCIAIIVYLIFTVSFTNKIPFADESDWQENSENLNYATKSIPHPPLGAYIYKVSNIVIKNLRFVPLVINLMCLFILFYCLKKQYSEKVGLLAIFLAISTFWFIFASTQIDLNGAILNLLFLIGIIILIQVDNKDITKKIMYVSIILILIIYTKYAEYIIFSLIYVAWLVLQKDMPFKKKLIYLCTPFTASIALFSLFPLIAYLTNNYQIFLNTIHHVGANAWSISSRPILILCLYGFLFLLILPLSFIKMHKKDTLFFIWILAPVLFYCLIIGSKALTYERYLMIILLPCLILIAKFLKDIKYDKYISNLIQITIFYFIFLAINIRQVEYIPHNITNYLKMAMSLSFSFNFPYFGSSGPFFYINFESLILLFAVSVFLWIIYFYINNKKILFLLISLNLAFNLFLITNYGFNLTHYDYNKTMTDIKEYYNTHNLIEPVYVPYAQKGLLKYLNVKQGIDISSKTLKSINKSISEKGGTAILFNFPKFDPENEKIKIIIQNCELNQAFSDKNDTIAWIYFCKTKLKN